jgi:hypothetical protein
LLGLAFLEFIEQGEKPFAAEDLLEAECGILETALEASLVSGGGSFPESSTPYLLPVPRGSPCRNPP